MDGWFAMCMSCGNLAPTSGFCVLPVAGNITTGVYGQLSQVVSRPFPQSSGCFGRL